MEECKSPEAEALVAAAVSGPNQAASAAARVEAEAHAAVAVVQAGVDARRAEALAAVQAESENAVPRPLRLLLYRRILNFYRNIIYDSYQVHCWRAIILLIHYQS